jgi:hypothetical protein
MLPRSLFFGILCFSSSSSCVFILLRLHSVGKTIFSEARNAQGGEEKGERGKYIVQLSGSWRASLKRLGFADLFSTSNSSRTANYQLNCFSEFHPILYLIWFMAHALMWWIAKPEQYLSVQVILRVGREFSLWWN